MITKADTLRGRQDYRYDPVGRILAALPTQVSKLREELFAFDPAGNLLDDHVSSQRHYRSNRAYQSSATTACVSIKTCTMNTTCMAMSSSAPKATKAAATPASRNCTGTPITN
uniref:hypothetical protein n=1 Tax=Diaphorobacter aerolatus TaxID=1288495 RepID=UPI0021F72932|nr:hypothetical protein [Diaphorobacter aerolatus]